MTTPPKTGSAPTPLRVAAAQFVSTPDVDENLATAGRLVAEAAARGAALVALPEYFCLMGRQDSDKVHRREADGDGPIQQVMASLAREHGVILVAGTIPLACPVAHKVYNTTLVYGPDGARLARYDKIHLFGLRKGEERFDESVTILPGRTPVAVDLHSAAIAAAGFTHGMRVGLSICYDLRFAELYRNLSPVDLILVPSAFTHTTGSAHWETLLKARAIENQCYLLAPAQGGRHPNGRRTFGHSMLVDPWGEVLAVLPEGEGIVIGEIQADRIAEVRASLPALTHRVL